MGTIKWIKIIKMRMASHKGISLTAKSLHLLRVQIINSPGQGLMMIQVNMITADIVVTSLYHRVTEIHIIKGHLQLLRETSDVIIFFPAYQKTCRSNTDVVVNTSVVAKIMVLAIVHLLKLVDRTSPYIGNSSVLDKVRIRVNELSTHCSHMAKLGLGEHLAKPALFFSLNIII